MKNFILNILDWTIDKLITLRESLSRQEYRKQGLDVYDRWYKAYPNTFEKKTPSLPDRAVGSQIGPGPSTVANFGKDVNGESEKN